jgi:hypothetical protein
MFVVLGLLDTSREVIATVGTDAAPTPPLSASHPARGHSASWRFARRLPGRTSLDRDAVW